MLLALPPEQRVAAVATGVTEYARRVTGGGPGDDPLAPAGGVGFRLHSLQLAGLPRGRQVRRRRGFGRRLAGWLLLDLHRLHGRVDLHVHAGRRANGPRTSAPAPRR